jgi:hypothetical protein
LAAAHLLAGLALALHRTRPAPQLGLPAIPLIAEAIEAGPIGQPRGGLGGIAIELGQAAPGLAQGLLGLASRLQQGLGLLEDHVAPPGGGRELAVQAPRLVERGPGRGLALPGGFEIGGGLGGPQAVGFEAIQGTLQRLFGLLHRRLRGRGPPLGPVGGHHPPTQGLGRLHPRQLAAAGGRLVPARLGGQEPRPRAVQPSLAGVELRVPAQVFCHHLAAVLGGQEPGARRHQPALQGRSSGIVEHRPVGHPRQEAVEGLARRLLFLVGPLGEPPVDVGAGHPLEQQAPLLDGGAQEGVELALGQEHRAAELVEGEADLFLNDLEGFGLGRPVACLAVRQL